MVSTLYQWPPAASGAQHRPTGICLDQLNRLIVTDAAAHAIYRLSTEDGSCTLLAGTEWVAGHTDASSGAQAQFNEPHGVCMDIDGNLLVADSGNHWYAPFFFFAA
jgi:hypothetical protein